MTERVREALFSSLESMTELTDTRVLDLFSGSGGFGFEALSRGAGHVTFVESDRRAAGVLRGNARALGFTDYRIEQAPVRSVLNGLPRHRYDIVFADPPFALDSAELDRAWGSLVEYGWLAPAAVVIVERFVHSPAPVWPTGLAELRTKRYGDAAVYWAIESAGS